MVINFVTCSYDDGDKNDHAYKICKFVRGMTMHIRFVNLCAAMATNVQSGGRSKNYHADRIYKFSNRWDHSFSTYAKFSEEHNISYPLIRIHACAYQGERNVSFTENLAYVLNE